MGMNNVVELKEDNLVDWLGNENLIVVFSSDSCNACKNLKPYLYELDEKYTVVIVDAVRHVRSSKFMAGGIQYYPTIGLFNRGYFIKELSQFDIIEKTID